MVPALQTKYLDGAQRWLCLPEGFVEFFAPEQDVERIVNKIDTEGKGWVDYFVVNLEVRPIKFLQMLPKLTHRN